MHDVFAKAISGLDAELQALANALAREILVRELERRQSGLKKSVAKEEAVAAPRRRGRPPGSGRKKAVDAPAARSASQLALQLPPTTNRAEPSPAETARPVESAKPQESALPQRGGRIAWNRETVITALVPFVKKSMEVDAAYLKRHGPKGMVPAALRFFGRLPAALNVACLRAAELAKEEEAAEQAQG